MLGGTRAVALVAVGLAAVAGGAAGGAWARRQHVATAVTANAASAAVPSGVDGLRRAAEQGSAQAMFLLANAYRAGAGVARDPARALALYQRAAELEHAPALQALAMAYRYGELGLEPDEDEARRYAMEAEHAIHAATPPR